jgi:hypothetical protein
MMDGEKFELLTSEFFSNSLQMSHIVCFYKHKKDASED